MLSYYLVSYKVLVYMMAFNFGSQASLELHLGISLSDARMVRGSDAVSEVVRGRMEVGKMTHGS